MNWNPSIEGSKISGKQWALHSILFLATLVSCSLVGSTYPWTQWSDWWRILLSGMVYSIPLMAILLSHEMGHYLMARRYGLACTLPYFIPFPITLIGTMGAVIRIKSPILDKKALFDIGAAGPLAGFLVSTLFILIGIPLSTVVQLSDYTQQGLISLGEPLLFKFITWCFFPSLTGESDLVLHPMAMAGWVGYLVTALNLMPIGQLDGGHISYAMLEDRHIWVSRIMYFSLLPMAYFFPGWLGWFIVLYFLGIKHPSVYDY
ncbi:MAG: site-2 protease family protein [Candidatus Delongbacteria bacterium]|nr:site-2 protease family protein [Candidatus Delongbacteria bacterium]